MIYFPKAKDTQIHKHRQKTLVVGDNKHTITKLNVSP